MALISISSDGNESQIEVNEDRIVIGRAPSCEVVIDDTASSRKHCEIDKGKKGWRVTDLDSSNGTKLNGTPIERAPLKSGDVIMIGHTKIRFEESPVEEELIPVARAEESEEEEEIELFGAEEESSGFILRLSTGDEIPLVSGTNRIGRSKKNEVSLTETGVSGVHAACEVTASGVVVRDLGSTNGTLVNGAKVSGNQALAHGDRIQLGTAKLQFVDVARRGLEGDDALDLTEDEAEDIEVSTLSAGGKRSGFGSLLFLLLFIVILGGGGYFAYIQFTSGKARPAEIVVAPEESLVRSGWSFEDDEAIDRWLIGDKSARTRVRAGKAVSGTASLCLAARGEGADASLEAVLSDELRVSHLKQYRVEGFVSSRGGSGLGLVKLEWWAKVGTEETYLGEVLGDPVSADEKSFVSSSFLVSPPRRATHGRVGCMVVGADATFCFDDFTVVEETGATQPLYRDTASSRHRLGLTDRGVFELTRESTTFFSGGELLMTRGGEGGSSTLRQSVSWRSEDGSGEAQGDSLHFAGHFLTDGGAVAAKEVVSSTDSAAHLSYRVASDAGTLEVGMTWKVDGDYLSSGLKIVGDSGLFELRAADITQDYDAASARSLIFGNESERIRISLAVPARFSLRPVSSGAVLTFLTEPDLLPTEGGFQLFDVAIQTSFDDERARAAEMCALAETWEGQGKLGQAQASYLEVLKELPFNERALAQAQVGSERIRSRGTEVVAGLNASLSDARILGQPDVFASLQDQAQAASVTFSGVRFGEEAKAIALEAKRARDQILLPRKQAEAQRLYRTALDLLEAEKKSLAKAFLTTLVLDYGGTEQASKVKEDPRVKEILGSLSEGE